MWQLVLSGVVVYKEVTLDVKSLTGEIAEQWFLQEKDKYSDGKKVACAKKKPLWDGVAFIVRLLGHFGGMNRCDF